MAQPLNSDAKSFVVADPFRCRVWALNARIANDLNEVSCREEIESFRRYGQLIPVVGRTLRGDPDADIEVICGARRLFVARILRIPLHVELRELTDQEAAFAVHTENVLRKQTSPYERGLWFARLLEQKVYRSESEMTHALGIAPTQVSRLRKFAELPAMVINAFASPHDILESWAAELNALWHDERRHVLAERALALSRRVPRPPALSVYEILMASRGNVARSGRRRACHVAKAPTGEPLVRFEYQRRDVVLRIANILIDATLEKALVQAVVAVLTQQTPDRRRASVA